MHFQWGAVQNRTKPLVPSCWKGINIDIQKILIYAIDADYTKRKTANQMLELFQNELVELQNLYRQYGAEALEEREELEKLRNWLS